MSRYLYSKQINEFCSESEESILGTIGKENDYDLTKLQKDAWRAQISILKNQLEGLTEGTIAFEYTIPRMGLRIDNVLLYKNLVFLLEFKINSKEYLAADKEQIIDYALNIKNFHKESHTCTIIPVLVATAAPAHPYRTVFLKKEIHTVVLCNAHNLGSTLQKIATAVTAKPFSQTDWLISDYLPTPTIIEAAQRLYREHQVSDISRNDAGAINLEQTSKTVHEIIEYSKSHHHKSICFITGVPGAGKTLAGLNIATQQSRTEQDTHAVFLSGNGPLVKVLQEALARDKCEQAKKEECPITKKEAISHTRTFIQLIHHFRDDVLEGKKPIAEKVVIFDEAQRAWNSEALSRFMEKKKGKCDYHLSEPEFLIQTMDRHQDWCVLICLIGGGQEINTGEAGMNEWFKALRSSFSHWHVYVSDKLTDVEYVPELSISSQLDGLHYHTKQELHLAVSLRSFRSENVSLFVKKILDNKPDEAKQLYQQFKEQYPIYLTRNIEQAKTWIKSQACGSERYGIVACSSAMRLKPHGIWVKNTLDVPAWFLNKKNDIRSSYCLEDTATEFDIQGLELDWVLMAWDANLRIENNQWASYRFKGSRWEQAHQENAYYLKNAYRVLLTRARQGMAIFVPEGSSEDATRKPEWYDSIYQYLHYILEE